MKEEWLAKTRSRQIERGARERARERARRRAVMLPLLLCRRKYYEAHAGDVELEDVEPDRAAALGTFPKEHPSRFSDSRLFPIKQGHRETKSPLYPNKELI